MLIPLEFSLIVTTSCYRYAIGDGVCGRRLSSQTGPTPEGPGYGLPDDTRIYEAVVRSILGIGVGINRRSGDVPHLFLQACKNQGVRSDKKRDRAISICAVPP